MVDASLTSFEFPPSFRWGAAAASYQIEGAARAQGRGESVWDMFCLRPGATYRGHDGRHACDHFHRYAEDVALMAELGLQAYRFSISWPRVLPEGRGVVSERGFDFYDRLVDALLERGITPWATLFHWDYPLALFREGGWLNRDSADWFADYAELVVRRLSDRVRHFLTLNEPQVFLGFGHHEGVHAPGLRLPLKEMLQAGHHALLAHGRAILAMRAAAQQALLLSYAPVGMPQLPQSDSTLDVELARRATFTVCEDNSWNNAWWMDPVYLGVYPDQGWEYYGPHLPDVREGDLQVISQPLDAFAVNIYQGWPVVADLSSPWGFRRAVDESPGFPTTAFDWPVTPSALHYGPKFFYERYGKPIVVTENGLSCRDWVSLDDQVHDPTRIDFTTRYLREFARAINEGVEALGYFHWSILDNFEWAAGYRERFGLVHVDYTTQKRTPKDSFYWYKDVIRTHGKQLFSENPLSFQR